MEEEEEKKEERKRHKKKIDLRAVVEASRDVVIFGGAAVVARFEPRR